jgi:adenylate cyclase
MFLDLKGSTSIAEKLTNKTYSAFIRDFFNDVSNAIILYRGEIYQYEGDGVIISWPVRNSNLNCIRSFFKIQEILDHKKQHYLSEYAIVPEFKGAIHAGPVVVTEVGKQKKEIVFHGDVLNTTSRMQGKCNELGQDLLISEDLLEHLTRIEDYRMEKKGAIEMRGKSKKLTLYGVQTFS